MGARLRIAPVAFGENDWAPAVNGGGGTTTTTTTPCTGTLSGNAFKGGSAKAKKALAGVVVSASNRPPLMYLPARVRDYGFRVKRPESSGSGPFTLSIRPAKSGSKPFA